MAKFRSNYQPVSGTGKLRMVILVIALIIILLIVFSWMEQYLELVQ